MTTSSQKKKKYEHILWDWNGTLLDDVDLCIDAINLLLKEYKLPYLSKDNYRRIVDFPIVNYYQQLGFNFNEKAFEEIGSEFMEIYRAKWRDCRLQPDAEKVLKWFQNQGLPQSILSATEINLLKQGVEHFKVREYFQELTALNHQFATSKIELGKKLVEKLKVPPSRLLLIGDTLHDFKTAQAIGADCLLLSCGHHPPELLSSTKAPLLSALKEIPDYLDSKHT
ncbi:MAG: HAD family hydrolase [Candidatus Aminicenantes bacterium]|nr:HAD family hydrolase [Candidatus Aminicenantes bacterium]